MDSFGSLIYPRAVVIIDCPSKLIFRNGQYYRPPLRIFSTVVDEICPAAYRGMPMVVDESVDVRVRELDGDTERKRQRFRQVQAISST